MKKILLTLTVLTFIGIYPAYANHAEGLNHDVVIKVDGMVCDFCAQSIKKVFGKEDAVEEIFVDLDNGEIIVDYKDGQTLTNETITKLVTDSGYTVSDIVVDGEKESENAE